MAWVFTRAEQLQVWATEWAPWLPTGLFVLLYGDLGSGKTTFVQGLARGLGITEVVTSPTFALVHQYPQSTPPLVHCDLYRLDPTEVSGLGIFEESPAVLTVIEWAERLPYLPTPALELHFTDLGEVRQVVGLAQGPNEKNLLKQADRIYERR